MAVKKKASLDELRDWWNDCHYRICAEYILPTSNRKEEFSYPLFNLCDRSDSVTNTVFLNIYRGIPHIIIADGAKDELILRDQLCFCPNGVCHYNQDGSFTSASRDEEYAVFSQIKPKEVSILRQLERDVLDWEKAKYKKYGFTYYDLLVHSVCSDIFLDEKNVRSADMYLFSKRLSNSELLRAESECKRNSDKFLNDVVRSRDMSRKDAAEFKSFVSKDISDLFHPWTILKGRLNHQLGCLCLIDRECHPADVARVVTWAEKDSAYAPYVGKDLEDWVKKQAKVFQLPLKAVNSERAKLGGNVGKKISVRPKLSPELKNKFSMSY